MEEERVLELAKKSLSFEKPREILERSNYDVFRNYISKPILRLHDMTEFDWRLRNWSNGVNLAIKMQAIFKTHSQAKLKSQRHAELLSHYDRGSPKLTSVIDVRYPENRALQLS